MPDAPETDGPVDPTPFPAVVCADCGTAYGHAPPVCRDCGHEQFEEEPLAGRGTVYASTVVRVPGADHQGEAPFTVGLVDVGDGPSVRVTARIAVDSRAGAGDAGADGPEPVAPGSEVVYTGRADGAARFRPV